MIDILKSCGFCSQRIGSSQLDPTVYGVWMIIISCRSCLVRRSYEARTSVLHSFCSMCVMLWNPGHKYIRPRAIHDQEVVDEYAKNYIYFACIKFINSVSLNHTHCLIFLEIDGAQIKTASLRWHSPMLDDISAVSSDVFPTNSSRNDRRSVSRLRHGTKSIRA